MLAIFSTLGFTGWLDLRSSSVQNVYIEVHSLTIGYLNHRLIELFSNIYVIVQGLHTYSHIVKSSF